MILTLITSAKITFPYNMKVACEGTFTISRLGAGNSRGHSSAYYNVLQAFEWQERSEKRVEKERIPFPMK